MGSCQTQAGSRLLRVVMSIGLGDPKGQQSGMNSHHGGLHYSEADGRGPEKAVVEALQDGRAIDLVLQSMVGCWYAEGLSANTRRSGQPSRSCCMHLKGRLAWNGGDSSLGRMA